MANDCRFTPDFSCIAGGRLVFVGVKEFHREDALIKAKVAARLYSRAEFQIVKQAKDGGVVLLKRFDTLSNLCSA